jgi:hypothetical protein
MAKLDNEGLNATKDLIEVIIEEAIEKCSWLQKMVSASFRQKMIFYEKMDQVMGELKIILEEQSMQSRHLSDHDERLQKIESHIDLSPNQ